MKKGEVKLNLKDVLPRIKLTNPNSNPKKLGEPIFVVFADDIKKYIIIDGHNRYYIHKEKKKRKIKAVIKGIQNKTDFFPTINYEKIIRRW